MKDEGQAPQPGAAEVALADEEIDGVSGGLYEPPAEDRSPSEAPRHLL